MTRKEQDELKYKEIREYYPKSKRISFYLSIIVGLFILCLGVFLFISDGIANGITSANRYGMGGGQSTFINGPGAIIIGLIVLSLSIFVRKKSKKIN